MKAGDWLSIWKIDEVIEKEVVVENDEFFNLIMRVQKMRDQGENADEEDEDIPMHLLWKNKYWGKVDRQRI
jgi:hypothetical protein